MGKFEEIKPQVIAAEVQTSEQDVRLASKDGKAIVLPLRFRPYLELLVSSHSLSEAVNELRSREGGAHFQRLFYVLETLYDHGFLNNDSEFSAGIDEIRKPYQWPEAHVKNDYANIKIKKATAFKGKIPILGFALALLAAYVAFPLFKDFLSSSISTEFLQRADGYWTGLISIYIFASVTFSLQAIVGALAFALVSGVSPALKFRFNLLGAYLDLDNDYPSYGKAPKAKLEQMLVITLIHLILFFAAARIYLSLVAEGTQKDLLVMIGFYLLAILTPFAKSYITRILALVYEWADNNKKSGSAEKTTYLLHQFFIFVWLISFAVLAINFLPPLASGMIGYLQSEAALIDKLSMLPFGLYFIMLFEGFVADILSSFQYTGINKSIRKYWHQSVKQKNIIKSDKFESFHPYEYLITIQPFNLMPKDVVKELAVVSERKQYPKGGVICAQGGKGRDMFVVHTGRVGVFRRGRGGARVKVVEFEKGALFGEVGFFKNERRTADVIALEDTQVLKIQWQTAYKRLTLEDEKFQVLSDRVWLMQTFKSSKIFKDLPIESLDLFVRYGQVNDVPRGQMILKEGDPCNGFYVIIQGKTQASKNGQPLREMKRGDVFGEIALILGTKRTASVHASSDVKLLFISESDFWKILKNNLKLAITLEKVARMRVKS